MTDGVERALGRHPDDDAANLGDAMPGVHGEECLAGRLGLEAKVAAVFGRAGQAAVADEPKQPPKDSKPRFRIPAVGERS